MSSPHRQTLVSLAQQYGWKSGVEVGVDKGILFRMLLEGCPDLTLTGVDLFPDEFRSRRVWDTERLYSGRANVIRGYSGLAAKAFATRQLDFVFIDADHSYDAVISDIAAWQPKVKVGGWLGGHDYHPRNFPGVVKAVDRVFGKQAEFYPGAIWGVWC